MDVLSRADYLSRVAADERMKLSIENRNALEEEIHGAHCQAISETPELLEDSLRKFREALDSTKSPRKTIYDRIAESVRKRRQEELKTMREKQQRQIQQQQYQHQQQHRNMFAFPNAPSWDNTAIIPTQTKNTNTVPTATTAVTHAKHYAIDDDDFRLRFLRCELFDVQKAVERFLEYLNLVHELWGFELVSRRLVQREDFAKEDYKFMKKGYVQLLPFRDRSGRRIVVLTGDPEDKDLKKLSRITMAKCFLYIMDIASRDSVESQQRGVVLCTYPKGMLDQVEHKFPYVMRLNPTLPTRLPPSLPTRLVAGHHFLPDSIAHRLVGTALLTLHSSGKLSGRFVRHKFYVGYTKLETEYRLMGYGIPVEYLPFTDGGKIKLKYWNSWMKLRTLIESQPNLGIVECPGMKDVIFRHGQAYKTHGNDTLREWIENEQLSRQMSASSLMSSSSKGTKMASIDNFCARLIHEIQNKQKGRFLKWDNTISSWVIMRDELEIKKKISASFYNYCKRNHNTLLLGHGNYNNGESASSSAYNFIDGSRRPKMDCCSADARRPDSSDVGRNRKKARIDIFVPPSAAIKQ